MCLSVYVGSQIPFPIVGRSAPGDLDIEPASWRPPPLIDSRYVYYVGQRLKNDPSRIGCSCPLMEHLQWGPDGPTIIGDELYLESTCPFESLKRLCSVLLDLGETPQVVSDDSNGIEQSAHLDDYASGWLFPRLIERGNLLFTDGHGDYAWRSYTVLKDDTPMAVAGG